jgi:protein SCO1/2
MPEQVLLVDFIYTNCPTYCAALGSIYAQLARRLADDIAAGKVRLVSISFDPARDGAAELAAYRARYGADGAGWDLGRPAHSAELERWLKAFGVVVIPDGMGGYTHNAAVHVVGPDRRLAAIHGLEDIDAVVTTARGIAGTDASHVASR